MLEALEENEAGAVQRWENSGERTPHPSFFFTKVGTWKGWLQPSWGAAGYCVTSMRRQGIRNDATDVGARLLWMFDRDRIRWLQMRRSNTMNIHPVMFGVYENICYHHGAGSRSDKQTREDLVHDPVQRRWVTQDGVAGENREKDLSVRAMIKKDFNFWMKFVENPSKNPQKHIKKLKE
jgi:hypothetical protein